MDYYSDSYQANDSYQTGSEEGYRPSTGGTSGPSGGDSYQRQNSPPLLTEKIVTERKQFFLDLKENNRGRVVKITATTSPASTASTAVAATPSWCPSKSSRNSMTPSVAFSTTNAGSNRPK